MGEYAKGITKRINHVKLNGGKNYCVICGAQEKLTEDHVPPKVATPNRDIVQYHVSETLGIDTGAKIPKIKGLPTTTGSRFKTICKDCNSLLGCYDGELGELCKIASRNIAGYFQRADSIRTKLYFECDVVSVMRSVAGHMISATTTKECLSPPNETEYWKPLREFVLTGKDPSETHDFFCWFYPYDQSVSAKNVVFRNNGHTALITTLSFYPIAFLVVLKGQGISPFHAHKISLVDKGLLLDLTYAGVRYSRFPFHGLKGDQLMALNEALCVISVPKRTG